MSSCASTFGLLLGLCAACAPTAPQAPSGELTRVVVLDPGMTEVFIHLDLLDRMVGRPQYTDHLHDFDGIPVVGTGIIPNYEAIVLANPQFIFTHASRGKALKDLQVIAPTENFKWLTVSDVANDTRAIGALMGCAELADHYAAEIESGLAPKLTEQSPRVLMLLGIPSETSTELWYAKRNSLHGAALEAAGGVNAVTAIFEGPPSLSIEALLKIDPDIIVVMAADHTPEQVASHGVFWARLPMLTAVRNGKISFMTGREYFSTGPRVLQFKDALLAELSELQENAR